MPDVPGSSSSGTTTMVRGPDPVTTADYILDMSNQLAKLAADARFDLLAYLLDMVRIEAELVRGRVKPGPGGKR